VIEGNGGQKRTDERMPCTPAVRYIVVQRGGKKIVKKLRDELNWTAIL
jgi:hypothetical protein